MPPYVCPRRRVVTTLATAVLLAFVVGACGGEATGNSDASGKSADDPFPMTVESCDSQVTLQQRPQRVLTDGSEAPLLVAAAGAANRIVAKNDVRLTNLAEYTEELGRVPTISSSTGELSTEEAIALKPDLVISRQGTIIDLPGIPIIVVSGRCEKNKTGIMANGSFEQIFSDILSFGRILGTETHAQSTVDALRQRVATLSAQAARPPSGTTAAATLISNSNSVFTYGKSAIVHTQMTALGLRNTFGDQSDRVITSSVENVLGADPDVLIVLTAEGYLSVEQVITQTPLKNLRAVREGRVLTIPFAWSSTSPLAVNGLQQLSTQLSTCGEPPVVKSSEPHRRCP